MTIRPESPIPGPSNRIVPEPGTTIVIPMPNPIEGASNLDFVLHPGLEERNKELTRKGHAVLDQEHVTNPMCRNLNDDPFEDGHDEIFMNSAEMSAEISRDIPIDSDLRSLRDLLVRCLLRAEIMNIQLNNALGLKTRPPTNAGKRHTWINMLSRYDYIARSMNIRDAEIRGLNFIPGSDGNNNNNQEMNQEPVPDPTHADPTHAVLEPKTPCTRNHCSCSGPNYCQWEQETEMTVPRNAEIPAEIQDEASGFQDVGPPTSSVIDSDDNSSYIPWSKGPDPRNRNGDSSDDDYKPDFMTENTQEAHATMEVQEISRVFNNFIHTPVMNGSLTVNTTFDIQEPSIMEEPEAEAEADPIQETPARPRQYRRSMSKFRKYRSKPE
jgi:hypothetical protein